MVSQIVFHNYKILCSTLLHALSQFSNSVSLILPHQSNLAFLILLLVYLSVYLLLLSMQSPFLSSTMVSFPALRLTTLVPVLSLVYVLLYSLHRECPLFIDFSDSYSSMEIFQIFPRFSLLSCDELPQFTVIIGRVNRAFSDVS